MPFPQRKGMRSGPINGKSESFVAASQLILGAEPVGAERFDLPRAVNVIQWVSGREFLDFPEVYSHWGQYQFLRDFFQLRCPVCNPFDLDGVGPGNCWGKTKTQLEDEVLLERAPKYGESDVCPKCKGTRDEFVNDGLMRDYNTAMLCIGMCSGKSAIAGALATYLEHEIYCFAGFERDILVKKFRQAPGTSFDIGFVATSAKQAEKTIWDYFISMRERSPWMQRYVKRIKSLQSKQINVGMKLWEYKELTKVIENGLIGVSFQSLHSNSASMAGATRIAAFIDELARFDTTESKRSADEVWRVLSASLKTMRQVASVFKFPANLFGLKMATSSPISIDDKMMTMLGKSDELDSMYAIRTATWNWNPFQPRSSFEEQFKEDPIQAERDFGANPPLTETPFIEDVPRFSKSVDPGLTPSAIFRIIYPEDALNRQYIGIELVDAIISPNIPRFVCFDAGESRDSFAGAMGYPGWVEVAPDPDSLDQSVRRILVTIYDWVFRILPEDKPKRTVWFESVVQIIRHLKDHFRISQVVFDRWNSVSLIQNIRAFGVPAEQEGVTASDFLNFKSDAYMGRVKLLPPATLPDGVPELEFLEDGQVRMHVTPDLMSASGVGVYELVKLSRSSDLKKIYNPKKGSRRGYNSDDVAQVIVGVHRMVQTAMSDDPSKMDRKDRLRREQMGGEMWGGGAAVQTMRNWSVSPQVAPPTGLSKPRTGIPGYSAQDTWVSNTGMENRSHNFGESKGIVRVKRW